MAIADALLALPVTVASTVAATLFTRLLSWRAYKKKVKTNKNDENNLDLQIVLRKRRHNNTRRHLRRNRKQKSGKAARFVFKFGAVQN